MRLKWLAAANTVVLLVLLVGLIATGILSGATLRILTMLLGLLALGAGAVIVLRVGGADMPVTISLLNALSGVAAAFAGFALGNFVLVAVGGIVGASGLMLTQIMCRAMNRHLGDILAGRTTTAGMAGASSQPKVPLEAPPAAVGTAPPRARPGLVEAIAALQSAKQVILVPGYGMAVAQAQQQVKVQRVVHVHIVHGWP